MKNYLLKLRRLYFMAQSGMFGISKKRNPETLAKQFYPIVSDPAAFDAFGSAFESCDDNLLRAFVSRFCFLEWVAVYHGKRRRDKTLEAEIRAAFFHLITTTFRHADRLIKIEKFFANPLELQLVLANMRASGRTVAEFLPLKRLTEIALEIRNESYAKLVRDQTDLVVVLMCVADFVRAEIHGGSPMQTYLGAKMGDKISCLNNDWERVERLVPSL